MEFLMSLDGGWSILLIDLPLTHLINHLNNFISSICVCEVIYKRTGSTLGIHSTFCQGFEPKLGVFQAVGLFYHCTQDFLGHMYHKLSDISNFRSDNVCSVFIWNWTRPQSFSFQAISLIDFGGENVSLAANERVSSPTNPIHCYCNFSGLVVVCIYHLELKTFGLHLQLWVLNSNHSVLTLQFELLLQFHLEFWHLAGSLFPCFNVWGNTVGFTSDTPMIFFLSFFLVY